VLDLELRLRVHALMTWLTQAALPGIIELTPGIRSLQVHYESRLVSATRLLEVLAEAEAALARHRRDVHCHPYRAPAAVLGRCGDTVWPSQVHAVGARGCTLVSQQYRIHSPHQWTRQHRGREAHRIRRQLSGAGIGRCVSGRAGGDAGRSAAPLWSPPSTIPARTWTPENAVGIGGAYLCVYGMEGPGGYQFVGRTCQMWNTYHVTREFQPATPWLLRFFDQIRFYPVSGEELLRISRRFSAWPRAARHHRTTFRLRIIAKFLPTTRRTSVRTRRGNKPPSRPNADAGRRADRSGYAADMPSGAPCAESEAEETRGRCIAVAKPVVRQRLEDRSGAGQSVKSRRHAGHWSNP
jgi:urea carboxylase